jgi:Arc/MetJ-type ribon-helix-helix transcriptional regulator
MIEKYKKKIVVRITESQYQRLRQNILEDESTMSQVIREAIRNKLKNIHADDQKQRKFKF